jgi:GT2 family glycosyltransferase/glycosyltransferase involved in cell wall biosynthesis
MNSRVSIVIPIYEARELTERCIASVLRHAQDDFRLILVNDCGRDEALLASLRVIASDPRVLLLENEQNLGFVRSANIGMRAAGSDDVLLLNSDTEVFEGFLHRLRDAAYCDVRTGIVSPFSNNATLCSFPVPFRDNPIPEGWTPSELAKLVADCSSLERPELVTAVGFCMFIRNRVFADTGYFDEATYGRGFGEENAFCEVAKHAGWKVRLADDVFVYHKGKASFGDEGRALERKNLEPLEAQHPGYLASIERFAAADPLNPIRKRIRLQLLRSRNASRPALLFLLHASPYAPNPGGTEFHVLDLVESLRLPRAVIGFPTSDGLVAAEVLDGEVDEPNFFRFHLRKRPRQFALENSEVDAVLRRWIRLFGIHGVHIHHLMNWPLQAPRVFRELGLRYAYTAHDYFAVCPNWNLFDRGTGRPCPCDGSTNCFTSCLPTFLESPDVKGMPPDTDVVALREQHRAAFSEVLRGAHALIFPSVAAREIVASAHALDVSRAHVIEHGYGDAGLSTPVKQGGQDGRRPLRLLVLGEVGSPIKGSANYLELIQRTRKLPLEWHFIGHTPEAAFKSRLKSARLLRRVIFHGRVKRLDLFDKIEKIEPDLAVLLPAWHETFSYALSEMVLAGLPVLVNNFGAPAERTRANGFGRVVTSLDEAETVLEEFSRTPQLLESFAARALAFRHPTLEENAKAHHALYDQIELLPSRDSVIESGPLGIAELADRWEPRQSATSQTTNRSNGHQQLGAERPKYQSSALYPLFKLIKPLIPAALRRFGRARLVRNELAEQSKLRITWYVLRADEQAEVQGMRLLRSGARQTRWLVRSPDPQLVFTLAELNSRKVRVLRFRLRHELECSAVAQVYWTHGRGESFEEYRSAWVVLDAAPDEWREYEIRLDEPWLVNAWRASDAIHQIRFDPINFPGTISLSPLEFGE